MNHYSLVSHAKHRFDDIGTVFIILLASISSCIAQFEKSDAFVDGQSRDNFHNNVEFIPIADVARFVREPVSESERTWLEEKFVAGTSPYYFRYGSAKGCTDGYCLVKNGVVVSSFTLSKDRVQPPELKYTIPPTLQIDVSAESIQPSGYPVLLKLTLTNRADTSFTYFSGGPADYPSATLFSAEATNDAKQIRKVVLANGQITAGRGHICNLDPGQKMVVPASVGVLPVGPYRINVGDGKSASVTVRDDAELERKQVEKIIVGVHEDNPFMEFVTAQYQLKRVLDASSTEDIIAAVRKGNSFFTKLSFQRKIQPVLAALEADLTSTDKDVVSRAAGTILLYGNPPVYFTQGIVRAMQRQLDGTGDNAQIESTLAWLASEIGSEDAMVPVLNLLHNETSGLDSESRSDVVTCLAEFKQERATDALRDLLNDPEVRVRTTAALALAQRKDPAGLAILIADGLKLNPIKCSNLYDVLLQFPEDSRVEAAIKRGLDNQDISIRHQAEEAQKALHTIRILKNHGVVL